MYFFVWISFFTLTNSVDPDKMQYYVAFHLVLYCYFNQNFVVMEIGT